MKIAKFVQFGMIYLVFRLFFGLLSGRLFFASIPIWIPFSIPVFAMTSNLAIASTETVQLVQSFPLETSLAQPSVPLTADVWLDMIKKSKSSIDLAQFYISSEPTQISQSAVKKSGSPNSGEGISQEKTAQALSTRAPSAPRSLVPAQKPMALILNELEAAAKRGVRIRLLISKSMMQEDPETLRRFRSMRGDVKIRALDMFPVTGGVMHSKYWIVDRKEIFVGSQNFDWRSLIHTHELGARIQDEEIARQLRSIFDMDWNAAISGYSENDEQNINSEAHPAGFSADSKPPSQTETFKNIELVSSPQGLNPIDIRFSADALVQTLNQAKTSIRVQLHDYSPVSGSQVYWPDLDNAIRAAALRGVKVQMLLSDAPTALKALDYLKSLSLIPGIEIKLVKIPAFSAGHIPYARVIHSKYLTVDQKVLWIGTSNWSKGYFYHSRNTELILRKPELAQVGNQIFDQVWNSEYVEPVLILPLVKKLN